MEVDGWVGFSDPLLRFSARREPTPRDAAATRPALFAVLVAEATNLGLASMARASGIPYGQLLRVHESCFGEDALREAIATLVRYHRSLPLTASFGPGTTSSSDGMRFGTSASGLHARHLPRYLGMRRGVSLYSHVSDQGSQFWVGVINCQLREATFVLDGLLYQDALPTIREHYTDTHGYTDLLFGLFELLGFRFAPRLRDLPDQTLYRARRTTGRSTACCDARSETTSSSSTGTTSTAWPRRSPMGSCRRRCSSPSCRACGVRTPSSRRSKSSAAWPRPVTCSPTSTTRRFAVGSSLA